MKTRKRLILEIADMLINYDTYIKNKYSILINKAMTLSKDTLLEFEINNNFKHYTEKDILFIYRNNSYIYNMTNSIVQYIIANRKINE